MHTSLNRAYQPLPCSSLPGAFGGYYFQGHAFVGQVASYFFGINDFSNFLGGCLKRLGFRVPFLAQNLRIAIKSVWTVKSSTNSRCTARMVKHLNKQRYVFLNASFLSSLFLTSNGPAKSIPVLVNGGASSTLLLVRFGGNGVLVCSTIDPFAYDTWPQNTLDY